MLLSCGAMSEVNMTAPRSPGNWLKYCFVKVLMTTNSTLPRMESTVGQPLRTASQMVRLRKRREVNLVRAHVMLVVGRDCVLPFYCCGSAAA